jgi:hypothetical protein
MADATTFDCSPMTALDSLKRLYGDTESQGEIIEATNTPLKKVRLSMKQVFLIAIGEGQEVVSTSDLAIHLEKEGVSGYFEPGKCFPSRDDVWARVFLGKGYDGVKITDKDALSGVFSIDGKKEQEKSMFKYSNNQPPTVAIVREWTTDIWKDNLMQWWMVRTLYVYSGFGSVGATRK